MTNNSDKPTIIFVLGMHRSGTSLVAQMVAKWGAFMGSDLMKADWYNQDGYWEYNPLVNLHDKMLEYIGYTWYAPPKSIDVSHLIDVFGNEGRALVDNMDSSQSTWCWKDPRISLFLPFWQSILKKRNLLYIFAFRNPLSVSVSLKTRNSVPVNTATAIWELYNLKIFEALKSIDICFFAQYEKLIDKPDELTKQLFDFLNTQLQDAKNSKILVQMRSAIKPDLKHSLPPDHISIDKQQTELYTLLKKEKITLIKQIQLQTRFSYTYEITELYHKSNDYKERNLELQLLYKSVGDNYNKTNSLVKKYEPGAQQVVFDLNDLTNIECMRFDPLSDWLQSEYIQLELYDNNKWVNTLSPDTHNAIQLSDGTLLFATNEPHIHFKFNNYKEVSFNKVIARFNYLKIGNECKMFFAENPGLFLIKMLPDGESPKYNDNSFSALFLHLEEKMIQAKNLLIEYEILKQTDAEKEELSQKNKLELEHQQHLIDEYNHKILDFGKLLNKKNNENSALHVNVQTQAQTISLLKREKSNLQKTIDLLNHEKEKLETVLFASFTDNETLKVEQVGIKNELKIARNENNYLLNKIKEKENRLLELQSELEDRNTTIEEQNTKYKELSLELQNKEKQMQKERNSLEQELKNINDTVKRLMANERSKLVHKYHRRLPLRLAGNLWRFIKHPLAYYRMRRDTLVVRRSGLFDDGWYLQQYPDLYLTTVDMLQHYMLYGAAEGRNPNPLFDANYYLNENPDVKNAGINPLLHFICYGVLEGRKPNLNFDPKLYLETNPEIKNSGINPLLHFLLFNNSKHNEILSHSNNSINDKLISKTELNKKVEFNAEGKIIQNNALRNFFFIEPASIYIYNNQINLNHLVIHWVIPDFPIGSGGHMTIFRIIKELERNGCKNTLWIHNVVHKTPHEAYSDIINYFQLIKAEVKFIDDKFMLASGDVIFATDWSSVAYVNSASNFLRRFYFVQDHESEFHATGSLSLLAQQTYCYDLDCICAGKWLEKVVTERYGRWARSFNLAIDHSIYNTNEKEEKKGKVKIAFYARFSTPRRAVELAFLALERLANDINNFEVHCYGGEKFIQYAPFDCYWHGVLNEDELAKLYRYCDIGIVFSATNYSLVPQEMMACGLAVAEIDTECNRIVYQSNSITLLSLDASTMVSQLKDLIFNEQKRKDQVVKALSWIETLNWKESGKQCHKAIIERLKELGYGKINHNETKRLAIFASHDIDKIIDPYVVFYIKALSELCDIIFVTDYDNDAKNIDEIKPFIIKYINEYHNEYDFGSYKRGYNWALKNLDISSYDWIILCNDSVYGPLFDLKKIIFNMEESYVDFWGFTQNNIDIVSHLQSYFVSLNRDVFLSEVFKNFIFSIKEEQNKRKIVTKYEHYLTKNLLDAGFTNGVFFEEEENDFKHDPMKDWSDMILDGFPFIKKRLFTENEYNLKGLDGFDTYVKMSKSTYNSKFIIDNLNRTFFKNVCKKY